MFPLVQQIFLAKTLVKSLLISILDKIIYYIGTFLQRAQQNLFLQHNIGWTPAGRKLPFFQHASSM
jgi:hypothetical protein